MRKRWLLGLALVPLIFFPTCYGTYRLLRIGGRDAVRGNVTTDFPVLAMGNGAIDFVPYASNGWKGARLLVPESERATLRQRTLSLTETRMQRREGDHIAASAEAEAMQSGLQRIHVEVHRAGAMGTRLSESWYDTDGVRVIPRFERQYSPSWNAFVATIISGPLSILLAALAASRYRRAKSSETVTNS
jgi:hypothetical protein